MPTIHSDELTGRALDCAVAVALGHSLAIGQHGGIVIAKTGQRMARPLPQYEVTAGMASSIIWGASIATAPYMRDEWEATLYGPDSQDGTTAIAETPMRAGLLCFVRAKLGASVCIPDAVHKVLELQK